jgi:hypothetical protein
MRDVCRDIRDLLIERAASGAFDGDLRLDQHLQTCLDCQAELSRARHVARGLRSLRERRAPFELTGRVVAALQAGQRQERALDALRTLTRAPAPVELEQKLDLGPTGSRPSLASIAPNVLERLVAEELEDPAKAVARRFAGRLEHLAAPPDLLEMVEARFRQAMQLGVPKRSSRSTALLVVVLLAGLTLVGLGISRRVQAKAPEWQFQVVRARSVDELGPMASILLDQVSGGARAAWTAAKDNP